MSQIGGNPLVGLGGDFWHTPFPIGQHGGSLIRVVSGAPGILDSSPFTIDRRFLAFRLGGSAGSGVGIELRIPARAADGARRQGHGRARRDRHRGGPDRAPVRVRSPHRAGLGPGPGPRSQPDRDAWARSACASRPSPAGRRRLLVDYIRLSAKRPPVFHRPLWGWADIHCHPMAQAGFGDLLAGHMHGPVEDLGNCLPLHGVDHGNLAKPIGLATGHHRHNDGSRAATGWTTASPRRTTSSRSAPGRASTT